ncbi:MAG: ROK family glucokinase [Planctomycetota bacterium]
MEEVFIGVDLGGTNIKAGCFDAQYNLIAKTSVPTGVEKGPEFIVENIIRTSRLLLEENHIELSRLACVGIGSPGPLNRSTGIIIDAMNLGLRNVPLRQMVSEGMGVRAVLENDANAACWGEYVLGAGKGVENMVFFTLGTGIGGGVVSHGRLIHGIADNAAELGHIIVHPDGRLCGCGQRGCVEAYASASNTAKRAMEALQTGTESSLRKVLDDAGAITCKDVFEHQAAGDKLASEIVDGTAKALGLVCVSLFHVLEPSRVVFAGGMIAAGEVLLNRIRYFFSQHIWRLQKENLEICFATLGEDAGIIGSAALAIQAYKEAIPHGQ